MFDCRDSPSNSARLFHLVYMLCYALHFMLLLLFCFFLCKLKTESHSLALQWRLSETPSALLCCRAHSIENRNEIKSRFGAAFNVTQIFLFSKIKQFPFRSHLLETHNGKTKKRAIMKMKTILFSFSYGALGYKSELTSRT